MLIVSPPIVDKHTKSVPLVKFIDLSRMRDDLARKYKADKKCPVTAGTFCELFQKHLMKNIKLVLIKVI